MPETSIIVRTFNEAQHMRPLFESFSIQSNRDFEVIVVDSGSFDGTRELADELADRVIRIAKHDFTFGFSLNTGIEAARGRFCAIVSAHTIPTDENWLEALIAPLRDDESVAMTYGRQTGLASSKFSEAEDFERLFGPRPPRRAPVAVSRQQRELGHPQGSVGTTPVRSRADGLGRYRLGPSLDEPGPTRSLCARVEHSAYPRGNLAQSPKPVLPRGGRLAVDEPDRAAAYSDHRSA
jgi:glycosyltransferase involved in cell wall biosynthesis